MYFRNYSLISQSTLIATAVWPYMYLFIHDSQSHWIIIHLYHKYMNLKRWDCGYLIHHLIPSAINLFTKQEFGRYCLNEYIQEAMGKNSIFKDWFIIAKKCNITKMFFNWRMSTQTVVYPCIKILPYNKIERTNIYKNIHESQINYFK